jgi:hypothetical protein
MNLSKKTAVLTVILGLGALAVTSSCSKSHDSTPAKMTLYDSLGGTAKVSDPANAGQMVETGYLNIRNVVDSAIFIIAGDAQLQPYFTTLLGEVGSGNLSGFQRLSTNLTTFIAVAAGAKDYTYAGLSMANAHNPATNSRITMKVDSADFNEFIGDVATSFTVKNKLPTALLNQVAPVLFSVEGQVVQR